MHRFFPSLNASVSPASLGLLTTAARRGGVPRPLPVQEGGPGLEFDISEDLRQLLGLPLNPRPDTAQALTTVFAAGGESPANRLPAANRSHGPHATHATHEALAEWTAPMPQRPDAGRSEPIGALPARTGGEARLRITNREQALKALQDFEAQRNTRLPQLGARGTVGDRVNLSMGMVHFMTLADLLSTFPCALRAGRAPAGEADAANGFEATPFDEVVYPHGPTPLAYPRSAYLGENAEEIVVARRPSNPHRIRYTTDLERWHRADIYTDDAVEAEKLALWTRIFEEACRRVLHLPPGAPLPGHADEPDRARRQPPG